MSACSLAMYLLFLIIPWGLEATALSLPTKQLDERDPKKSETKTTAKAKPTKIKFGGSSGGGRSSSNGSRRTPKLWWIAIIVVAVVVALIIAYIVYARRKKLRNVGVTPQTATGSKAELVMSKQVSAESEDDVSGKEKGQTKA